MFVRVGRAAVHLKSMGSVTPTEVVRMILGGANTTYVLQVIYNISRIPRILIKGGSQPSALKGQPTLR
jgi:hypothetical protein